LTVLFGPDSPKPASPEQASGYVETVRAFKPEAMNIVYVEYDLPAERGMGPWSAVEAPDGMIWIPYYGRGNAVVRLNPDTGEMTPFQLPFEHTAGIHSVYPAKDGTLWFVETALGKIGQLDPKTKQITEYQSPQTSDGKRPGAHTIRVDDAGIVWVSGGPVITKFNPKSGEWKHFPLAGTYGNESAPDGSQWFTAFRDKGPIGRVKDDVLTTFQPPTNGKPQRLAIASDGTIWFTERQGNKLGHLDPVSGAIKEFELPGPEASPYAINIDPQGMIWYPSHEMDTMNRFDPKTGKVVEYPYPHAEIAMREFFADSKGRVWYGASTNNKVGYFYLNDAAK
jgi:virginiamycin B lyase